MEILEIDLDTQQGGTDLPDTLPRKAQGESLNSSQGYFNSQLVGLVDPVRSVCDISGRRGG